MAQGADEALVREIYDAFNRRDLGWLATVVHPEVEWVLSGLKQFPGTEDVYRGPEGVADFFQTFLEPWPDLEIELESTRQATDGRVVAFVRFRVRGAASGIDFDAPYVHVCTLRDGKLAAVHAYDDPTAALAAVGLDGLHDDVETVRRAIETFISGDVDGAIDRYFDAENGEFVSRFGALEGGHYRGEAGARQYFHDINEAWESYERELEQVLDAGAGVVAVVNVRAVARSSGVPVERQIGIALWVRDGRIVRMVSCPSIEEAHATIARGGRPPEE